MKAFIITFFGAATPGVFVLSAIIAKKHIVYGQGPIACTPEISTEMAEAVPIGLLSCRDKLTCLLF